MKEFIWRITAWLVSRKPIANLIISYAIGEPYFHLKDEKTGSVYMFRYWLFNPHPKLNGGKGRRWVKLPSIRAHKIMRRDLERDDHSHPWPARTIILDGWYSEKRGERQFFRMRGDTATLSTDDFHRITEVSHGGVWTLFIMWDWEKDWGFKTPNGFVKWRDYLGIPEGEEG